MWEGGRRGALLRYIDFLIFYVDVSIFDRNPHLKLPPRNYYVFLKHLWPVRDPSHGGFVPQKTISVGSLHCIMPFGENAGNPYSFSNLSVANTSNTIQNIQNQVGLDLLTVQFPL